VTGFSRGYPLSTLGWSLAQVEFAGDEPQSVLGSTAMKIGRYATSNGASHIGESEIALTQNEGRPLFFNSARFPATTVGFQHVRPGGKTAWHNPPQPWLAFILAGTWKIETSDGSRVSRRERISRRRHERERPSRLGGRGRRCTRGRCQLAGCGSDRVRRTNGISRMRRWSRPV